MASRPSNIAPSRLLPQPPPGSSPLSLRRAPASNHTFLFLTPSASLKPRMQPPFSSEFHSPFSRKPSCPRARAVLTCLDTLCFSPNLSGHPVLLLWSPCPIAAVTYSPAGTITCWALSSVRAGTGLICSQLIPRAVHTVGSQ